MVNEGASITINEAPLVYTDNCQSHEIKTKSLSFNSCEKVLFSFRRKIKSSKDGG